MNMNNDTNNELRTLTARVLNVILTWLIRISGITAVVFMIVALNTAILPCEYEYTLSDSLIIINAQNIEQSMKDNKYLAMSGIIIRWDRDSVIIKLTNDYYVKLPCGLTNRALLQNVQDDEVAYAYIHYNAYRKSGEIDKIMTHDATDVRKEIYPLGISASKALWDAIFCVVTCYLLSKLRTYCRSIYTNEQDSNTIQ